MTSIVSELRNIQRYGAKPSEAAKAYNLRNEEGEADLYTPDASYGKGGRNNRNGGTWQ
jgi:hypothetical protein